MARRWRLVDAQGRQPPARRAAAISGTGLRSAAILAAKKAKDEEIAFQKSVIEMIAKNLERDLADLAAAAKDPKTNINLLRDLQFRAIHQASNLTEEQDRLRR